MREEEDFTADLVNKQRDEDYSAALFGNRKQQSLQAGFFDTQDSRAQTDQNMGGDVYAPASPNENEPGSDVASNVGEGNHDGDWEENPIIRLRLC